MEKPVKKIRVGTICATVWQNTSKEGKPYPSVSLERIYKDTDGAWKSTGSLRQSDLPTASMVLSEVFRFLTLEANA